MSPHATDDSASSRFEDLCKRIGKQFPNIAKARVRGREELRKLSQLAESGPGDASAPAAAPDTSIVVFGSLARTEVTSGSDVDWSLLVDSPADLLHQSSAREFSRRVKESGLVPPGREQVFGGLSFSHDLVHWIGGERDTNSNMTRRLLLLLESRAVARPEVHKRVVRNVLHRYIDAERSFLAETGRRYKVPRFLLNDVVRYWRTMAVDYASKRWERGDEGWALRNMKLRFSRKLLFASGLLTCFSCYLEERKNGAAELFRDAEEAKQRVHQHIAERLGLPPLDVLSDALLGIEDLATAFQIMTAYDAFLAALDSDKRNHLKDLDVERSYADGVFNDLRSHSHAFQAGLTALFTEKHALLRELTFKYGLF